MCGSLNLNKLHLCCRQNYFQALKIYNQALKIYNQTLKIYFQALKIIFKHAFRGFGKCASGKCNVLRRRRYCASSENMLRSVGGYAVLRRKTSPVCFVGCAAGAAGLPKGKRMTGYRKNASICANKNTFPFEVNEKKCKFVRG